MDKFTHFDAEGSSHMVDIGEKPVSRRIAIASGLVEMEARTQILILDRAVQKGDVLELARVAGVMATKRTAELIPLCHPLRLDSVKIEFEFPNEKTVKLMATVSATDRTGVEMEALTAVAVGALTIYDMCKSVDRAMRITNVQLEEKSGGKSGLFVRDGQTERPETNLHIMKIEQDENQ